MKNCANINSLLYTVQRNLNPPRAHHCALRTGSTRTHGPALGLASPPHHRWSGYEPCEEESVCSSSASSASNEAALWKDMWGIVTQANSTVA